MRGDGKGDVGIGRELGRDNGDDERGKRSRGEKEEEIECRQTPVNNKIDEMQNY